MTHDDLPVARAAPELSEEDAKAVKSALRWSRLSVGVLVGTTIFQVATGSGFGALLSAILLVMTLCCGVRGLRQGNGTKVLWHARAHACCACLIVVFVIPAIFISLAAYNCACSVECREMFLPNPADFAPASNASGLAPADHNRSSDAPPSGFKSNLSPMESHRGPPPASGPHADGEQPADREKPADGEQIEGEGSGVAASRRLSAASSNAEAHRGKHHHDRRFASRAERRAAKAAHKAARRAARRAAANGEAPEAGEGPHGPEDPHSRRHGKAHAIAQAVFKTFMGHIGGTRDTPAGRAGPHHRDQARPQHEDHHHGEGRPHAKDRQHEDHHHGEGRPHAKDRQHEDPEEAIDESPAYDGRPGDMKMDDALANDAAAPAVQPRLGAHARRMQADSNRVAGPPRPKGGARLHGSSRAESHHDSSGWHSAWHSHSHDDEDEAAFSWHSGGDSGKHGKRPHGGFGGRWGPDGELDEDLSREDVAAFVAEATEQLDMMCTVSNGMSGPAVFLAVVVSTLLAGMHFKTSRAGFAAAAKLPSGRGCGGPFRGGMLHTTAGLTPARLQGGNASTAPAPQAPAQRPAGPGAHAAAAGDDYPFSAPVAAPATGSFMSRIRGMVAQQRGYATVESFDDAPPRAAPVGAGSAAVAPPQQAATAPPPVSYEEYLRLVAASS